MKIGIVTSHTSFKNNYGAVLQCYALCEQLKLWNIEPHVINYTYQNSAMTVGMATRESHSIFNRLKYIFSGDVGFIQKIQYRLNRKNRMAMEKLFVDFYKTYIPMTSAEGKSFEEISENGFGYDGYITGSDQVWNPIIHNNQNDPCCFLQFAEDGAKRIAYAPSFGIAELPENCKENLKKYVDTFDAVSVREVSGQKILFDAMGKEYPIVLDPTMMADEKIYQSISSNKPKNLPEHYILCYRFGKVKYFEDILKKVSRKLGLPVVELPLSIESYGKRSRKTYSVGPAEFIGTIKGADLVMTDSFHCSVFSILNHKPFYTFYRQANHDKNSMNGRMADLLDKLNLQDRLIANAEDYKKIDFSLAINYDGVDEKLSQNRQTSQEYLKKALGL